MRSKHYLMNSTLSWVSEPDHAGSTMHLNLYGFRDAQWDVLHKRARRILFVGDSFVEGFMVADDETIPAVFARRARAAGQAVEVFNLGVGAAGLSDYMKIIQDAVPALKPDEIVLVFYANDFAGEPPFTPGADPPAVRAALSPGVVAAHRAGGAAPHRGRAGGATLARRGEAVPRGRARSDESVDRARGRARAEGRSRHRRRDAPRDVQSACRRRARRIRRINSSGSST